MTAKKAAPKKPSVGRIVHFRRNEKCEAAIVTAVNSDTGDLTLVVFPVASPIGEVWAGEDPDGREDGTWHWPDMV